MSPKKIYYENVDILRGFAILLMVLGHAVAKENVMTDSSSWCQGIYKFIYSFHMPLFFIISGFCFSRYENYGKFLLHKSRYLLVPYFIFNFITMILQRLLPFFTLVENNLQEEMKQIFFFGGSIWFVYVLFVIMVIFPLLEKLINDRLERAVVFFAVFEIVHITWGDNIGIFCISQVTYYLPYFIFGHMIRIVMNNKDNLSQFLEKKYVKISLALMLLIVDFGILYVRKYWGGNYMLKVLAAFIGSAVSYLLISSLRNLKIRAMLKEFGQYSLQIYLFNGYFISVSRTLVFGVLHIPNTIVLVVANFLSGMICNYIWCFYIFKNKFIKFLCGKR